MTHTARAYHARFAPSRHPAKRLDDPTLSNRAFTIFFVITVLIAITLLLAPNSNAGTKTYISTTGGALNVTTNWSPTGVPTTTDEALFTTQPSTAVTLSVGNSNLTFGDLIWNNNTSSGITASNGSRTLTLSGGGGSTAAIANGGAAGDLIVLGTNATTNTLTIGSTTVGLVLGASGNFDVVNSGATLNIAGAISETGGSRSVTKTGAGLLIYSGASANTYTGTTTVNSGELDLNKTAGVNAIAGNLTIGDGSGTDTVKLLASDQIANTAAVQIDGTSGVLNLNGKNETIGSLADRTGGTGTSGSVQLGPGTLTISPTSGSTTFSGVISGGGNLVKTGNGTQVLAGNNTYTGTTAISGGTLEINNAGTTGKLGGTSGITVNSGGTLLLSGSSSVTDRINDSATFTLNGGTFKTGGLSEGAPGTNGIGALSLTSTSTIDFGLTNTSVIQFAGVGTQTNGQILQLINWNGNPDTGGTGDRLLFAGTYTQFTNQYTQNEVSFNGVSGYNIYQFGGFYEVTAVPEPGTWFGAGLALLAVLYTQRGRLLRLKPARIPKN
jgi:autotransporter-associated beta strand protein